MKLNQISKKITNKPKRLGRGHGCGKGKTSGRGTKGQKARAGHNIPNRFEGGQSSLITRLPKKIGFRSICEKPQTVDISVLEKRFKDGDIVSPSTLFQKNIVKSCKQTVKILGKGKLTKKLRFKQLLVSATVKKNIGL